MAQIAIDIVLRLPQKLEDEVITHNNQDFDAGKTDVKLGKKDFIPHISLLMGVIEESDIGNITKRIQAVAEQFDALRLSFESEENNILSFKKTKKILDLHKYLKDELGQYLLDTEVRDDMFMISGAGEKISDSHKLYVKNFATEHSDENFEPHITTYIQKPHNIDLGQKITATTLGLYQLGYSCTCRKELFLVQLLKAKKSRTTIEAPENIWDSLSVFMPLALDILFILTYATIVDFFSEVLESRSLTASLIIVGAFIFLTIAVYLLNKLERYHKREVPALFGYPAVGFGIVLIMMGMETLGILSGNSVVSDSMGLWITLGLITLLITYISFLFYTPKKAIQRSTPQYFLAHLSTLFITSLIVMLAASYWEYRFVGAPQGDLNISTQILKTILLTPLFILFFASPRFLYLQKQFSWYSLITALAAMFYAVWHSVGSIMI